MEIKFSGKRKNHVQINSLLPIIPPPPLLFNPSCLSSVRVTLHMEHLKRMRCLNLIPGGNDKWKEVEV